MGIVPDTVDTSRHQIMSLIADICEQQNATGLILAVDQKQTIPRSPPYRTYRNAPLFC